MAVGGQLESRNRHAAHAGDVRLDEDRTRSRHDTQHVERQGWFDVALRQHDQRDTPDDAVAFGADAEQAAAGGGLIEYGQVPQQPRKIEQERPRVGAQRGDRHRAGRHVGMRHRRRQPGFTENHTRLPQRLGKRAVGARRCPDFLPGFRVKVAENVGDHVRRKPVGLREDDVECDDQRTRLGQASDQIGEAGSRPRPLTELSQALLVDVDDDDRALRCDARLQDLEEIECPETELFERCRIGDAQERQCQQQRDCKRPRDTKSPRQLGKPLHAADALCAAPVILHRCRNARMSWSLSGFRK